LFCHACGTLTDLNAFCGVLPDGSLAARLSNGKMVVLGKGGRRTDATPRSISYSGFLKSINVEQNAFETWAKTLPAKAFQS
jgi:hypothetical protein